MAGKDIHIAAAVITREDGSLLLVRKQGTRAFMQPGGKIDAGETPPEALCRELDEELGLRVEPSSVQRLGQYRARAANEPEQDVVAQLYRIEAKGDPRPRAEIAEMVWLAPSEARSICLAPLTRDIILPRLWPIA